MATGVNTITRTVGGALGAQLAAAILVPATESRYVAAFVTFGIIAVAALAVPLRESSGQARIAFKS